MSNRNSSNLNHKTIPVNKPKTIVAIIPARGGSKGVPKKNIRDLAGYPLIAYSIATGKLASKVSRVVVSTDSEEIAQVAARFGGEVPFIRPGKLAEDTSPDIDFIFHALNWFKSNEGFSPEYLIHLRPTTPLRDPLLIDSAIELMLKRSAEATSLRSVHELSESPYKMFSIKDGFLEGLYPNDPRPEYYNLPRQVFPPVYQPNGYVDIIRSRTVLESEGKTLHGQRMLAFITPDTGEVDKEEDFDFLNYKLKKYRFEIYEYLKNNFS